MPVGGAAWFGVVVVVPTLAMADQRDQPIVGAVVAGFVIAVPKQMGDRVDGPGPMQHEDGSDRHGPDTPAGGITQRLGALPATDHVTKQASRQHDQNGVDQVDEEPPAAAFESQVKRIAQQVTDVALVVAAGLADSKPS